MSINKSILFIIYSVDVIDNYGIALLSAVAKRKGWETGLSVFNRKTIDDDFARIKPDIVCYSVMSSDINVYLQINHYLKQRYQFISIMGGPHPTFFPEVIKEAGVDFICRGEGEPAFSEFLEKFEEGKDIHSVENFASKVKTNPQRGFLQDLDTLPLPDRSLIFSRTDLGSYPLKTFMTSRGCPFSCAYCYISALKQEQRGKGRYVRSFSVDRVITEINDIRAKYPLHFIKFEDDLFAVKKEWLEEFSKKYKKEVNLPFNCLQRLELINADRVKLLREANCVSVNMSVDSVNPAIRNEILNRRMHLSNAEIKKRILICKKAGLNVLTNTILGIPSSTLKDELDAVDLYTKSKVDYAGATILVVYPRTGLWTYCQERNILDDSTQDGNFHSIQGRSSLRCFSEKEKDIQWNLSVFFPLLVHFPSLQNVFLHIIMKSKPNRVYSVLFVLIKGYLYSKYIFPIKGAFMSKLKLLFKALTIETKRMLGKEDEILG